MNSVGKEEKKEKEEEEDVEEIIKFKRGSGASRWSKYKEELPRENNNGNTLQNEALQTLSW